MNVVSVNISTPVGIIEVGGSENGISRILYRDSGEIDVIVPDCLQNCISQLHEYFSGIRKHFDITLDPQGTDFQLKVWDKLLTIPYGNTISYLHLAKLTGNKLNTRAVGNANGKNKINIIGIGA